MTGKLNDLTDKQERFCLNIFQGMSQREAYLVAGYSSNQSPDTLDRHAFDLATTAKVMARIEALRKAASDSSIATVKERKQILSEIARGRLSHFIEAGQDGAWINIDPDKMNTAALQSIDSKTEYDENGSHPTVVTRIRLHSPVTAIAELNKMERIYEPENHTTINNQQINILVNNPSDKANVERLISGERT